MFLRALSDAASAVALLATLLVGGAFAQADAPLHPVEHPAENPELAGQVVLGKFLFWEEQMSSDNTVACGTCHIPQAGGSDPRAFGSASTHPGPDGLFGTADDVRGSPGVVQQDAGFNFVAGNLHFPNPRVTPRRTPSALDAGHSTFLFWDGRADTVYTDPQTGQVEAVYGAALESQAAGPPTSDVEMTHAGQTWNDVVAKLQGVRPGGLLTNLPPEMASFLASHDNYPAMFETVYGDPAITSKRILFAIANYERTLVSDQTPMDLLLSGQITQLEPQLEAGLAVFEGVGNCTACHAPPTFSDDSFHNLGVRPEAEDTGRFVVTGEPSDTGAFKTPGLRNVKLRAPYFHNGGKATLAEVVEFYNNGGDFQNPNKDGQMFFLGLSAQQRADLVAFLADALTDPRVEAGVYPFSRPTLASEMPPRNLAYGVASSSAAGIAPKLLAHTPANIGNPHWLLGLYDAKPNATTMTAIAYAPAPGVPFKDPRYPVPLNVDDDALLLVLPGATDGLGADTVSLSIPLNTALLGMKFYAQWFIKDAAALATGGVYGSQGIEVEIR